MLNESSVHLSVIRSLRLSSDYICLGPGIRSPCIACNNCRVVMVIKMIPIPLSRLYDYASLIRNAVLTTMNETRVSVPPLFGFFIYLSGRREAHRLLLWNRRWRDPAGRSGMLPRWPDNKLTKSSIVSSHSPWALFKLSTVRYLILHHVYCP